MLWFIVSLILYAFCLFKLINAWSVDLNVGFIVAVVSVVITFLTWFTLAMADSSWDIWEKK